MKRLSGSYVMEAIARRGYTDWTAFEDGKRTKSSKNWNWNRMSMIGDYELESDIMDELYRNFVLLWMIC